MTTPKHERRPPANATEALQRLTIAMERIADAVTDAARRRGGAAVPAPADIVDAVLDRVLRASGGRR